MRFVRCINTLLSFDLQSSLFPEQSIFSSFFFSILAFFFPFYFSDFWKKKVKTITLEIKLIPRKTVN